MKLLIVEDEEELANSISSFLSNEHYLCEYATTVHEAIDKVNRYSYDCILLDLMLPGGSGLQVLEELRAQQKNDGVIIISAKNSIPDKIEGLKLGADDYLAKPFHQAELAARIESVIRRKQFNNNAVFVQNELVVNRTAMTASVHGNFVDLTRKEFDLLLFFIGNKNRVLSKSALAEHLSGDFADMFDNHDFVYAHIKNLKRKLSEQNYGNYIKTIYGVGYKWQA